MAALKYWLWLTTAPGLSNRTKLLLLEHFSSPEDVYYAQPDELCLVEGVTKQQAQALADKSLTRAETVLADCAKDGQFIVTMDDAAYPGRLRDMYDPPVVLYGKGSMPLFDEEAAVAVVGTRKCTPYGTGAASQLGYELARQGIEVERQPRPITVYALEILDYQPESGTLTFDCHCSKGTYIRSICDDIGRLLGCGAVMTALRRTMAAGFSLSDCVTFEALEAAAEKEPFILPIEKVFSTYPAVTVSAAQAVRFRNGGALAAERLHTKLPQVPVRVFAPDGVFLGLGQEKEQSLAVLKLFV